MLQLRTPLTALLAVLLYSACDRGDTADDAETPAPASAERAAPFTISDIGLQTPESVLYDDIADVYLVSNINGGPLDHDDNGFIARVRPNGTVEQLKWIDGATDAVTLHAPKGLARIGDTLYVADIDSVRAFQRTTGAPLGARGVPGAAFLNDLAVGSNGTLYVTDTGVDASFASVGKEAIYRFDATGAHAVASGTELAGPNGIIVDGDVVTMVGFGGNGVWRISSGGTPTQIATLPVGQLDGIVGVGDGVLLVSSWEAQAVYRVTPDGQVTTVVDNVAAPADIGWDSRRRRVLIPLFTGNAIAVREVR